MTTQLSIFDFQDEPVRIAMVDEQPWFVGADVCRCLGLEDANQAIMGKPAVGALGLDDDERALYNLRSHSSALDGSARGRGGAQSILIISESGLYALIFKSRKAQARKFRKWVTSEVLPALRTQGRYEMEQAMQESARGQLASFRSLLLTTAQDVQTKRLTPGQAQAIAITAQRFLESIKLEGETIGYEKMFGLQSDKVADGILPHGKTGFNALQGLSQPAVYAAEAGESGVSSATGGDQDEVATGESSESGSARQSLETEGSDHLSTRPRNNGAAVNGSGADGVE